MERQSQEINSNFDLEKIFGTDVDSVDNIINNIDNHITITRIPKKEIGKFRTITIPSDELGNIQRSIKYYLLYRYRPEKCAHGFVKKRSISTNALGHVKAKSVFKEDISNFFDNITQDHLKNVLFGNKHVCRLCKNYRNMCDGLCNPSIYKNRSINFENKCEEMKAVYIPEYCEQTGYQSLFKKVIELCSYNNTTPQGFCTSPTFANLTMRGFDVKMIKLAKDNELHYSRYADDIVFTSKTHSKDELKRIVKNSIRRTLWGFGFAINKKKTVSKSSTGRIRICGIVVNEKLNIQRSELRLFRAKVHHATVKNADQTTKQDIRKLRGYASFVMSVNRQKGKYYMDKLNSFYQERFGD